MHLFTEPSATSFWQFALMIGFIAGVAVNIVTIIVLLSNRRERREVSFAFEPAGKAEFERHRLETAAEFAELRREMKDDREANQRHSSARSQTIFAKIDETRLELVAQIEDVRKEQSQIPNQVIALLKNTNAI